MNIINKIKTMIRQKNSPQSKDEEREKILDSLEIGETWFDPYTGTRYECVGKLSNGESITIARSLNIEVI